MVEPLATSVWQALSDPWAQGVLQRAFAEVVLLGITGGALGCWVIFYELSYSAESLAHALFPGLVVAALVGIPILVGGALGLLVAALAVALAGRTPEIGRDTAVAVVVTGLLGLGALLALSPESPPGIQGLLFGDVLGVSDLDLALAAGLAAAVAVALWIIHWRLLTVGFDRSSARGVGVSALAADVAVLLLLAVAILVAVQGLGNLLVVAVLIGPAATARLLARRMATMIGLAAAIAVAAGVAGLYLSYYAGTAAGASIAGVMVATYLIATGASALRGRASRGPATIGRAATIEA
jgi:ABC-type Mn2+/Zn2+ transport system permease subunit